MAWICPAPNADPYDEFIKAPSRPSILKSSQNSGDPCSSINLGPFDFTSGLAGFWPSFMLPGLLDQESSCGVGNKVPISQVIYELCGALQALQRPALCAGLRQRASLGNTKLPLSGFPRTPPEQEDTSLLGIPSPFFPGSFFLENLRTPRENAGFLKRFGIHL